MCEHNVSPGIQGEEAIERLRTTQKIPFDVAVPAMPEETVLAILRFQTGGWCIIALPLASKAFSYGWPKAISEGEYQGFWYLEVYNFESRAMETIGAGAYAFNGGLGVSYYWQPFRRQGGEEG